VKASCILLTYNRPPEHQVLIEEAIHSFILQDYPEKELLVLNDCPGQHLECDAPGVIVINVPRRFRSLGEKRNAAIALTDGLALLPWDDDDIMLPWRISMSVRRLAGADYFNPRQYWLMNPIKLHRTHPRSLAHNCSIFTRSAFDRVGGYPHANIGEDADFDRALRRTAGVTVASGPELEASDWYYVYRWGVGAAHLSARGHDEGHYEEIGRRPIQPGHYLLRPHWEQDYTALTRAVLS
jgi:glycosyltransferase involved in cell wall biosynthesis